MSKTRATRTTRQKLALFKACFSGLRHVYGTYDPTTGQARQVKAAVTDEVVLRHLQGRRPLGVYLLVKDRTRAVVVDFDEEDALPPVQFIHRARHYGIHANLERSKQKGWHVWVFLEPAGVLAEKARAAVKMILADIEKPGTEIFPKQDRLDASTCYGNFINAPLFGALVPEGRTVFVDPDRGCEPFLNQWDVLEGVQRVPESQLDEIIEINRLSPVEDGLKDRKTTPKSPALSSFGLPPCAQQMLAAGVNEYQRVWIGY